MTARPTEFAPALRWFLLAAAVVVAVWGPVPEAAASQDEVPLGPAAHWILGRRLLADGETRAALDHLHTAYRYEPDEPAIALDFQQALAEEGFYTDAIEVLDRLIAAAPDSTAWRMRRWPLLLMTGRAEDALADVREVRRSAGSDRDLVVAEARVLAGLGRTDEAVDVLRDAMLASPPEAPHLYLAMADVLAQAKQDERIPALLREAVAAHPGDPGLRVALVRSLAFSGDAEGAREAAAAADRDLPAASAAEPAADGGADLPMIDDDGAAPLPVDAAPLQTMPAPEDGFRVELADYYARHDQPALALAVLEPMAADGELGLEPTLWLARLLLGTGRQDDGAALIADINDRWPRSGRGWFLRGRLAEDRRDWAAAVAFHRRAVECAPDDPELRVALVRGLLVTWPEVAGRPAQDVSADKRADLQEQVRAAATLLPLRDVEGQMVLGYALRTLGRPGEAAAHFGQAAEDPDLRQSALMQQSICLDETGNVEGARRVLELLRRENPGDANLANALGYFLAEKGEDLDLAADLVTEALEAEPANGAYLDSMGWVRYRQGRAEDALDYLIRAVNALPDDPVILEHLGQVLQDLGQHAEAGNVLRRALAAGGDAARLVPAIARADSAAGGGR